MHIAFLLFILYLFVNNIEANRHHRYTPSPSKPKGKEIDIYVYENLLACTNAINYAEQVGKAVLSSIADVVVELSDRDKLGNIESLHAGIFILYNQKNKVVNENFELNGPDCDSKHTVLATRNVSTLPRNLYKVGTLECTLQEFRKIAVNIARKVLKYCYDPVFANCRTYVDAFFNLTNVVKFDKGVKIIEGSILKFFNGKIKQDLISKRWESSEKIIGLLDYCGKDIVKVENNTTITETSKIMKRTDRKKNVKKSKNEKVVVSKDEKVCR